ncbi:ribonuclease R family protein [Spirulina subsalsa]|uniref:ribonuclease R family protein n=1 Tax=Spirulina subsalsa TaxID=54311 RepID=UPI00031E808F|nr:ribonuclease R family protein [Spirulina subsalsa]
MEFSIATLLAQFSQDKLVAGKYLEKRLNCEDEECQEKLLVALDALERIGVLSKEMGKYRRVYEEGVVEAKLRCSSKGFCFAIQDEEGADDIYVRESHLSTAWNGDRVLVRVIKEGSRRRSPEGEVKVILDRANPSLLARIKKAPVGFRAVPLDDRLLFELDLTNDSSQLDDAIDHLVHVEVIRYPLGTSLPLGRVTKILGSDAEAAADTDIVCCKHDLPQTFSEKVLESAKAIGTAPASGKLPKADFKNRLDLRSLLTVSLEDEKYLQGDKPQLIENAFSLEPLPENQWKLTIHIADFAHYIEPHSSLDYAARKRGTAVHLGELKLPMLPDSVIERCSLALNEERLAFSIILTLNKHGIILAHDIQPSVVQVDYQMSYQQIQEYLRDESQVGEEVKAPVEMLDKLFFTLGPVIKAQRLQRGGFDLHMEIRSPFKDEGRLGTLAIADHLPIQAMLMEVALLAGKAVADHCRNLELPAIYCTQPEPDMMELEDFLKLGINLGLDLDVESEDDLQSRDYQGFVQEIAGSSAPKILTEFLRSTLRSPMHSTKPGPHFGLAYGDGYCHVLSPGQRFADLQVQRVLHLLFEEGRDRRSTRAKIRVNLGSSTCYDQISWNILPPQIQTQWEQDMAMLINHLNERDKVAEDAERDLIGLKKAEKMKERTGEVFTGLITGVQSYGFFVEIEELMVEGLVHVSSLKDDWYEYRSRHSCLVGRKNRTAYRLGDRVEVQVKSVDYYRQQIDLVTVSGGSDASNEDFEDD